MTTQDLKTEIQKALDNVPENALEEVLVYLQELKQRQFKPFSSPENLQKILQEDEEVLKKLAQ